jgi:hypothetical protein
MMTTASPLPDEIIAISDAARETGLDRSTLNRQARAGKLKTRKLGNITVTTRGDLHTYLANRDRRGAGQPLPPTYRTPRGMQALEDVASWAANEAESDEAQSVLRAALAEAEHLKLERYRLRAEIAALRTENARLRAAGAQAGEEVTR